MGDIAHESEFMGTIYPLCLELDNLDIATPNITPDSHFMVTYDLAQAPRVQGWLQYLNAILGFIWFENLEGVRELTAKSFESEHSSNQNST